ncbi:MAG: hypothetical protein RLZZ292_2428 [Bacteroidota bacterium]|jgi:hypothetical protein
MTNEKIYFNQNGILVTNARFVYEGGTVAMSGITSVGQATATVAWYIYAILILILLFCQNGAIAILCFLAIAYLVINPFKTYYVVVRTAGVEQRTVKSNSLYTINEVIHALNQAIIHRG